MSQFGLTISWHSWLLVIACAGVWFWGRNKAKKREGIKWVERRSKLSSPRKEAEKQIQSVLNSKRFYFFGGWKKKRRGEHITEFSASPLKQGEGLGAIAVMVIASILSIGFIWGIPIGIFLAILLLGLSMRKNEKLVVDFSAADSDGEVEIRAKGYNADSLIKAVTLD